MALRLGKGKPGAMNLKRLKELVQQGPADVIIGKRGIVEPVLKEIDRRLKEKGVVKVRVLKSALKVTGMDRKQLARVVAEKLNALLLDVRGRTFVLYRHEDYIKSSRKAEKPEVGVASRTRGSKGERRVGNRS